MADWRSKCCDGWGRWAWPRGHMLRQSLRTPLQTISPARSVREDPTNVINMAPGASASTGHYKKHRIVAFESVNLTLYMLEVGHIWIILECTRCKFMPIYSKAFTVVPKVKEKKRRKKRECGLMITCTHMPTSMSIVCRWSCCFQQLCGKHVVSLYLALKFVSLLRGPSFSRRCRLRLCVSNIWRCSSRRSRRRRY